MKINIQNSDLKITAGLVSQFPCDERPQIVFSGRSNVGKSSLINTLLGRKSLARVSSSPGKTVTINFYDVDGQLYFVDIPGYGFAKRSPQDKAKWSSLTDGFLRSEHKNRLILQLIDMKVGPTNDDYMMLDYLEQTGSKYIIVATKADKLNKTQFVQAENELKKLGAAVIPFSSQTKLGRDEIWRGIYEFAGQ